jgi:putative transposase
MSDYRRLYQPGGSYFFALVTHRRIKMLSLPENMIRLKSGFDKVMKRHPFIMEAFAILPDHLHCIWRMPAEDSNYSVRWRQELFLGRVKSSGEQAGGEASLAETFLGTSSQG